MGVIRGDTRSSDYGSYNSYMIYSTLPIPIYLYATTGKRFAAGSVASFSNESLPQVAGRQVATFILFVRVSAFWFWNYGLSCRSNAYLPSA